MFSHITKRILPALLVFGFIMITTPIRHYESFAGQSPELSVLTYCFGLVIGFAIIRAAVMLDVRKPKNAEPIILKKSGIAILASLIIILAGLATGVAYFLINYLPEKIGCCLPVLHGRSCDRLCCNSDHVLLSKLSAA